MRRTHQALATLALGLALVGATTAAAPRPRPPGPRTRPTSARRCTSRSGSAPWHGTAPSAPWTPTPAVAAQPAARTDPAAPNSGVDVPATLLVGLVGGLLGGAAVMVGWTATTRRRRPRTAAGT